MCRPRSSKGDRDSSNCEVWEAAPRPPDPTDLDARDVALGAVGDKDLVGRHHPGVEGAGDGLAERALALLGAVAAGRRLRV
jgi:hypothetical protein